MHRAIIDWLVDQRRVTLSYPGQNRVGRYLRGDQGA